MKIYRSRKTKRRVYMRWEANGQVGFAFTEDGPTYRADAERFHRCYLEV